ncbi:MAG: transcription antitermination factor NusB [Coprobacillus sp.]
MEKTRRQIAREKATIAIYQNLLVGNSLDEIITFLNEDETLNESQQSMDFCRWLIETTLENKESYQELIQKLLKESWTFERLGAFEKAILMVGTCELLESELPKTVVINEAIINAKRFCDEDSYKFINGVLGQVV